MKLSLGGDEPPPLGEVHSEWHHLTVMFCDLVGCTVLATSLHPEDYEKLLRRYHATTAAVVERFDGFIGQYLGDGLLSFFCYPKAREDAAVLAVRAALGILRAIEDLNVVLAREGKFGPIQVRLGLDTGWVLVGDVGRGPDVVGKVPNLASRLQTGAKPGTAVITGDTWQLVHHQIRCQPLGATAFRGFPDPVPVYEVNEEIEGGDPKASGPLIGREKEFAQLEDAWQRTAAGMGGTLLVRGEPGIGKSRLIDEFRFTRQRDAVHWLALSGTSGAQTSALYPVLALLKAQVGWEHVEAPAERFRKIERFVERFDFPREETIALLATLFGLPAGEDCPFTPLALAAARQRVIARLPGFLTAFAGQRPVVLAVEDLHWLDPSTVEALRLLLDQGLPPRVLLLATARPEFDAAWLGAETVEIGRLRHAEAQHLVESVAGASELPADLVRGIVRKADGVPLFIEELTRMVLLDPSMAHTIPDTLHALLLARLDRVTKHRVVYQLAAVIGGELPFEMLRALCLLEEPPLREDLEGLVAAGLLVQRGTLPEATFRFRHALIQDEAYRSLHRDKRRFFHEQIAQLLEERFPEIGDTQPELVAHHYTEAGRTAEAVEYWARAARQASERGASHEAFSHTERGLKLLPALGDSPQRIHCEIAFTLIRGWALTLHRGFAAPEVEAAYQHALELYRQLGAGTEAIDVAASLFGFYIATAQFAVAAHLADDMGGSADEHLQAQGWFSRGICRYYTGELAGALAAFEQARAILDRQPAGKLRLTLTLDPRVGALGWGSVTLLMLGRVDEALAWAHRAVERAELLRHPHSVACARHFVQLVRHWRGEPAELLIGIDEYLAFCADHGFGFWLIASATLQAWARGEIEPSARELEALQRSIAVWQRTGSQVAGAQHFASLAQMALRLGRFDEAFGAIYEGRKYVARFGEHVYEPQLGILEGVAWRDRRAPDRGRAEACFREAITQARTIGARWHELRASLELARLLQQLGRPDEARAALHPITDTFPQMANPPALCEARALLAALP